MKSIRSRGNVAAMVTNCDGVSVALKSMRRRTRSGMTSMLFSLTVSNSGGGSGPGQWLGGIVKPSKRLRPSRRAAASIDANSRDDCVSGVGLNGSRNEIARDDPFRLSVDNDEVEHLVAIEHLHAPERDLPLQCLEGAQEKLLSGLPARVERPRDLHAAE